MPWYSPWASQEEQHRTLAASSPHLPDHSEPPLPPQAPATIEPKSYSRIPLRQLTRDEQAELDLQAALAEFRSEAERYEKGQTGVEDPLPKITDFLPADNIHPSNLPSSRLPCKSRFDYAFQCQGFGGQFVHGYRYATFPRDCGGMWNEFWFCMRNKGRSEEIKDKLHRERWLEKDKERYGPGRPSSEDVWVMRVMPVKGAFQGDYEKEMQELEQRFEQEAERSEGGIGEKREQ